MSEQHRTTLPPDEFIATIRQSFVGAEEVYTQGSCVMFYMILKALYPDAVPYWSVEAKHMVTKINGRYWDITGEIAKHMVIRAGYRPDEGEYQQFSRAVALPQDTVAHIRFPYMRRL